MNIEQFIEQLRYITIHGPSDAQVIINGEPIHSLSVELQNPIRERGEYSGMAVREIDPTRHQVVSIAVNGRKHERMPVMRYR